MQVACNVAVNLVTIFMDLRIVTMTVLNRYTKIRKKSRVQIASEKRMKNVHGIILFAARECYGQINLRFQENKAMRRRLDVIPF